MSSSLDCKAKGPSLPSSPTEALVKCCQATQWRPKLLELRQYVIQGANICEMVSSSPLVNNEWQEGRHFDEVRGDEAGCCHRSKPLLVWLIEAQSIPHVVCCVSESPLPSLDFTLTDEQGHTPLHAMCRLAVDEEDTVRMIEALVIRLEMHPEDVVDWSQKTGLHREIGAVLPSGGKRNDEASRREDTFRIHEIGDDVLQLATSSQKLGCVWPLICSQPYFADLLSPIFLRRVWLWDWEQLTEAHQASFSLEKAEIIAANRSTGKLFASCVLSGWKTDPAVVNRWVQEGADVCFSDIHMRMPLLHRLILSKNVEAVSACCTIVRRSCLMCPVDWTVSDVEGNTPFHALCSLPSHDSDIVANILHIILNRLEKTSPSSFRHSNSIGSLRNEESLLDPEVQKNEVIGEGKGNDSSSPCRYDIVDFLHENKHGDNMFSLAGAFGHLSRVWRILKERGLAPFPLLLSSDGALESGSAYDCMSSSRRMIFLKLRIHSESDWNNVSSEDKAFFVRMI